MKSMSGPALKCNLDRLTPVNPSSGPVHAAVIVFGPVSYVFNLISGRSLGSLPCLISHDVVQVFDIRLLNKKFQLSYLSIF